MYEYDTWPSPLKAGRPWLSLAPGTYVHIVYSISTICVRLKIQQDTLLFWSDKTHGGVKGELRQIFLFDHRIFVALPANSDGFFDYQLDIKVENVSQFTE